MSRFEVDSGQVAAAGTAVQRSVVAIGTEVDAMTRHLIDLQSSWRGQAASQFQTVVEDWRATQERVRQSLEQISHALNAAAGAYADAEAATVRMFAG